MNPEYGGIAVIQNFKDSQPTSAALNLHSTPAQTSLPWNTSAETFETENQANK